MAEKKLTASSRWSFSRLSTFTECPLAFWLCYLQDPPLKQQENAFAEYGTLCHEILEGYAKGQLKEDRLANAFRERYDSVVVHNYPPFPKNFAEKNYDAAIEYFENFHGFGDEYEIVSAEQRFSVDVGGYPLVGISDLVLRNKDTGKLTVVDHKTKSVTSMKNDYPLYRNQLYLYALDIKQRFGEYPEKLCFNMIKSKSDSIVENFDIEQLNRTIEWTTDTIDQIFFEDEWKARKAQQIREGKGTAYYCQFICPVFQYCEEAQDAIQRKGQKKG